MKTLYYAEAPANADQIKSANPLKTRIDGARVFHAGFFDAIVRYGSFDRIFVPAPHHMPFKTANHERIQPISELELRRLREREGLILATPGMLLFDLARLRRLIRRPATPCSGIIHSLSSPTQPLAAANLLLSELQPWDALVCSSSAGKQVMQNCFQHVQERIRDLTGQAPSLRFQLPIIPLGIDTDAWKPVAEQGSSRGSKDWTGPVVLHFGRLSPTSKAELTPLLIAFEEILKLHHQATLVIAGDDTEHRMAADLQQSAASICGTRVQVIPNPSSERKRQLYQDASVAVSLSDNLQETFGISVLEAMSAGLPVIASDWSGYRELITHGVNGLLIPTVLPAFPDRFDDLRGYRSGPISDLLPLTTITEIRPLVNALSRVLSDQTLARQLGQAGARRAQQQFDWRVIVRQYEELWASLSVDAENRQGEHLGGDVNRLPYRTAFSCYPTTISSDQLLLWIAHHDATSRHSRLAYACSPSWFSEHTMAAILDIFRQHGEQAILSVVRQLADVHREDISIRSHIYRLWKIGLLERVD